MTEQYEQISSMVDGEIANLTSSQIKEVVQDEESFKVWQRYNLMKGILKDEVKGSVSSSFMDGFAAKFEKEPIVMAPKNSFRSVDQTQIRKDEHQNDVISLQTKKSSSKWMKLLGQGAIAASFVVAAVFGVNSLTVNGVESDNVISTTPYGGFASPVSAHFDSYQRNITSFSNELGEVMPHNVSQYDGNRLDPITDNELSEVESLLNDHDYQVSIYSVKN